MNDLYRGELEAIYKYFAARKDGFWIMKWENAVALYDFVKQKKFKKILDLGTGIGCSLSIVAQALKDAGVDDYHINTIEQFEKCHTIAQDAIPEQLRNNITFYRTDSVIWQNPDTPYLNLSIFKELPEDQYDFIIIDGPGPYMENSRLIDFPNGDIMKMLIEQKLNNGVYIFIDGRLVALRILNNYYSDNFYSLDAIRNDYNILERKDNEVRLSNTLLNDLEKMGYFN